MLVKQVTITVSTTGDAKGVLTYRYVSSDTDVPEYTNDKMELLRWLLSAFDIEQSATPGTKMQPDCMAYVHVGLAQLADRINDLEKRLDCPHHPSEMAWFSPAADPCELLIFKAAKSQQSYPVVGGVAMREVAVRYCSDCNQLYLHTVPMIVDDDDEGTADEADSQ